MRIKPVLTFFLYAGMSAMSIIPVWAAVKYEGGDGSSMEKAVVIAGAKNSKDGVPVESAYARKHYRDNTVKSQILISGTTMFW